MPATRGFYDEAFTNNEKAMIVPKEIAGYIGFRWPSDTHEPSKKTYVEGSVDKLWLPSVTELNIMNAEDYYTNPSDEAGSTVFEYFENYNRYINPVTGSPNTTIAEAIKTVRTPFVANNSKAMNYSIPLYNYQSTDINEDISMTFNSTDILDSFAIIDMVPLCAYCGKYWRIQCLAYLLFTCWRTSMRVAEILVDIIKLRIQII